MAVENWGEAVLVALSSALRVVALALPRLLAAALILWLAWRLSALMARGLTALLRRAGFNSLAVRSGADGLLYRLRIRNDSAGALATGAMWLARGAALFVAAAVLGFPALTAVLQQLLLWLPQALVALAILMLAGLLAGSAADLTRGATASAGFTNPDLLATLARGAIWAFAVVAALSQLGLAGNIVDALVVGLTAALALASGVAFGLGGVSRAREIVTAWHARTHQLIPRIESPVAITRRLLERELGAVEPAEENAGASPAPLERQAGGSTRSAADQPLLERQVAGGVQLTSTAEPGAEHEPGVTPALPEQIAVTRQLLERELGS